jgi:hypothetical protein
LDGKALMAGPIWALVDQLGEEAEILSADGYEIEAARRRHERQQLIDVIAKARGPLWVSTREARELASIGGEIPAARIRSWVRTNRVRTEMSGGVRLLDRDDLIREAST